MLNLREQKPDWFNPDGSMKPLRERNALERQRQVAASEVAHQLALTTAKVVSDDQAKLNGFNAQIERVEDKLRYCPENERPGLLRRRAMFSEYRDGLKGEMAEKARLERFANSRPVALVRENAESLRSWKSIWPNASEADVMLALAIANSNDFESPQALSDAYWAQLRSIEANHLVGENSAVAQATTAALAAERDLANSQVRRLEAERRLATMPGGDDANQQ